MRTRVSRVLIISISYSQAKDLLKERIKEEESDVSHSLFEHSQAVADFLYKIASDLKEKHPDWEIDPEKMRIAGLLHDIGKVESSYELHAKAGAEILKEEGLEEIAEIVKKHGVEKEKAEIEGIEGIFEPRTLEEELLTYADMRVEGDQVVSFEKRHSAVLQRKDDDSVEYRALVKGKKD